MKSSLKYLLRQLQKLAKRRTNRVVTRAMGRLRYFRAYDLGEDTFIFERGVWLHLDAHASVLIVAKKDLRNHGGSGYVMTITTGNHSVAALPLLQGQFWDLCRLNSVKRGEVMMHNVLCGNVVNGKLEISQRDVPCSLLIAADQWLTGKLNIPNGDVIMVERNEQTLEHFRSCGQEWRVKPLAWTEREMSVAIAASRKRISTHLRYYHGTRGVHFMSYPAFHAFCEQAKTDVDAFTNGLRELVNIMEGHTVSFVRQPKFHGHHEIEFFGLKRGVAIAKIVPQLELLMQDIVLKKVSAEELGTRAAKIDEFYRAQLTRPELADESSKVFIDMLYMYLTGEIYSVISEGTTLSFDDRRTALPGAKFVKGRPIFDPLCDSRSELLLSNLRAIASRDEHVEYANVYELRTNDSDVDGVIGEGTTREIVYKTNKRPLVASLVEKKLAHSSAGYGSYVLARTQAFKSLGVSLPDYRLLRRRPGDKKRYDFFIRTRCDGEPLSDVPAAYFQVAGEFGGENAGEDPQVVLALATLAGDAAAQNLVMKKYDPATKSPLYAVGKEIYRFGYDINAGRLMPQGVSYCSVRGSFGWPDLSFTDRNLDAVASFYLSFYAKALLAFAEKHPVCAVKDLAEKFFAGFEFRLRSMEWGFTVQRDEFEKFDPNLRSKYGFLPKWHFVLWALERHVRRIAGLRVRFFKYLENPDAIEIIDPSVDTRIIEDDNAENVLSALEDIEIHFVN